MRADFPTGPTRAPRRQRSFALPVPRVLHSPQKLDQTDHVGRSGGAESERVCTPTWCALSRLGEKGALAAKMRKILICASMVSFGFCASIFLPADSAHADLCPYPGVGSGGGALFGQGGFCDYPTEINGSHMHCEAGGFGVNGIIGQATNSGSSFAFGGAGVGALSCSWRCPDGAMAPAPNPPGLWREYMVVMKSTNFCKDHMEPNGFWSEPVLPTEGIPPGGQPTEAPEIPGRPVPAPAPPSPLPTPGIPGALTPGIPNPPGP